MQKAGPCTTHCLYVTTGDMTPEEIDDYFPLLIDNVESEIVKRNQDYVKGCKCIINIPMRQPGISKKHCFDWVTRKEVFFLLTSKDYDGSSTVEKEEKALTPLELLRSIDWSDTEVRRGERYTSIPFERKGDAIIACEFKSAKINRVSEEFYEQKLFCKTPLPQDYHVDSMVKLFLPFVTSGRVVVTKTKSNNAFITFDNRDDAYFALAMMKKYYDCTHKMWLAFDHARK